MSIREDVVARIKEEESKSIGAFLNWYLERKEEKGEKKGEELTEPKLRQIIHEEVTAILEEMKRW